MVFWVATPPPSFTGLLVHSMRKGSDRIGVDKELSLSSCSAPDLLSDAGAIHAAAMTLRPLMGNKPWVSVGVWYQI